MPTNIKPKPKAKKDGAVAEILSAVQGLKKVMLAWNLETAKLARLPAVLATWGDIRRSMVTIYESETGAKANQVRLIDFIRWWEEREKSS